MYTSRPDLAIIDTITADCGQLPRIGERLDSLAPAYEGRGVHLLGTFVQHLSPAAQGGEQQGRVQAIWVAENRAAFWATRGQPSDQVAQFWRDVESMGATRARDAWVAL